MAVVLSPSVPAAVRASAAYHPATTLAIRRRTAQDVGRLASIAVLGLTVAVPLVVLAYFAAVPSDSRHFLEALLATGLYLPLHVRHVRCGLKGVRPNGLPWTLLAMAAVMVGFTPLLGVFWLYAFHALVASVLVTTRPRLAFPVAACILVVVGVWGAHFAPEVGRGQDVYLAAAVLDRAMMVFVPVWLVGALRRVRSARLALAEEALETERRRVDDELAATVGAQLEEVVRSGQRALGAIPVNFQQAEHELESLARRSRSALAEARRLIGHYKPVSSRAELEKAASLLRAAGIEVKVEVPDETLPAALDEFLRNSLRATVAKLLAEETNGPVALTLTHHDGASELVAMPTPITDFLA